MNILNDSRFLILTSKEDIDYLLEKVASFEDIYELTQFFSNLNKRIGILKSKEDLKNKIKNKLKDANNNGLEEALETLIKIRVFEIEVDNGINLEDLDSNNIEKIKKVIFISWLKHLKNLLNINNIEYPHIDFSGTDASSKKSLDDVVYFLLTIKAIELFAKNRDCIKNCIETIEKYLKEGCSDLIDIIIKISNSNMKISDKLKEICEFFKEKGIDVYLTENDLNFIISLDDKVYDTRDIWLEGANIVLETLYFSEKTKNESEGYESYEDEKKYFCQELNLSDEGKGNFVIHIGRHSYLHNVKNSKILYFESLSGSALHFPIVSHPSKEKKLDTFFEILENAFFRVAICDERVLESRILYENNSYEDLITAGVFFINKIYDFEINSKIDNKDLLFISKEDGKLCLQYKKDKSKDTILENLFPADKPKIHAIIIHQGILDKLKENYNTDIEEFIGKLYLDLEIPYVFITSGRGKPYNIPKNASFIPFASIESTILTKPHSKFLLLKQLLGG